MASTQVSIKGKHLKVPSAEIAGKTVVVTGTLLRVASIKDEDWHDGVLVPDPADEFFALLRQQKALGADLFTFSQKLTDTIPRFPFHYEWDSIASIPIVSYSDWWTNRVSTHLRQDVKRAAKRGVVVKQVPFTDDLVRGIKSIYDELPVRQGRRYWHYHKDFETVKSDNASYLERSDFLGAFWSDELIGFLKIVYVGSHIARLMQIIAKDAHRDKRPMNAMIAKAVELCDAKGRSHLIYGKYHYPQGADSLTAFKCRSGFEEILVPKYYVPLTMKGVVALKIRLHREAEAIMPHGLVRSLKRVRSLFHHHTLLSHKPG